MDRVVERAQVRLEELYRLLPDVEELEELRLSLVGAAVPDPANTWARSGAYATVDKRVISLERLDQVIGEAETAVHEYVTSLFSTFRPLFRTYTAGRDADAARYLIELGERQEQYGRYRKANQCFEAALAVALPLPDKSQQILALRRIARVSRMLGDLATALQYYGRSQELARDAQDLTGEVVAQMGYGNVLAVQGRWAEAEQCYRSALDRLGDAEDQAAVRLESGQLYNNLGMITTRQHRFSEAEEWFDRALELWTAIESPSDLAVCYFNQGLLRERQGRRDEARAIHQRALALDIPSALRAGIAIELADLYLKDGNVGPAERWGREAEEHAIAARSPYYLAEMYRGLGNIARAQRDEDGFVFYEKALEIARKKEYPLLEGETLIEYALLRRQSGEAEEAQSYLERAREIFFTLGAVHEQGRAEQLLEEVNSPVVPGLGGA